VTTTALYLHVPFCSRKCDYCGFHSITEWDRRAQRSFARAIERDLCELAPRLRHVRTLYLGGGTQTTLEPAELAALVRAAKT